MVSNFLKRVRTQDVIANPLKAHQHCAQENKVSKGKSSKLRPHLSMLKEEKELTLEYRLQIMDLSRMCRCFRR